MAMVIKKVRTEYYEAGPAVGYHVQVNYRADDDPLGDKYVAFNLDDPFSCSDFKSTIEDATGQEFDIDCA